MKNMVKSLIKQLIPAIPWTIIPNTINSNSNDNTIYSNGNGNTIDSNANGNTI